MFQLNLRYALALSVFAFLLPIQPGTADDGVLDSIQIRMLNGEVPVYTDAELAKLTDMVRRMQSSPTYYLGVIGTFSTAVWEGYTRKENIALNGGLSANRGGNVIAKLLEDCGLKESEMTTRVRFNPLSGETDEKEPFITVSLVEDQALRDFIVLQIQEGLPKGTSLISSLILPIARGKLTSLSDDNRLVLLEWVTTANTERNAKVLVFAATPEAAGTAKSLLDEMGLDTDPVLIPYQAQTQTNALDLPVTIFLSRDLRGESLSVPFPRGESDDKWHSRKKHNRMSVIVGASVNWSGNWDRHLTPGVDRTAVLPTADLGVAWKDKAAVFCKLQLPGSAFENDGGDVNLSEIKIIVRAFGPLCASLSREQYVSRHTERHASVPNYELVFNEKAPGWALGLHANLGHHGLGTGVGVGANVMFVDREYQIPPRWTIKEDGDVQLHVYVSYGISLFSFGK